MIRRLGKDIFMSSDTLICNQEGGVVVITLSRPEVMNSLNFSLLNGLSSKVKELKFNSEVRVIIITGSGKKAFCSGADLKERATLSPNKVKEYIFTIRNLFTEIEQLNKPVIAAINGIALGGGTELALASDIRVISKTAMMGLTETRLAIIPGAGGTQRLPRLVGKGKAKELIFTGRKVGAEEAMRIGLVNHVSPYDKLMGTCMEIANQICETGPIAIEQAKYAINCGSEVDIYTGLAIESNAYWVCIPTKDRIEGLTAFKEKRKPVYRGE